MLKKIKSLLRPCNLLIETKLRTDIKQTEKYSFLKNRILIPIGRKKEFRSLRMNIDCYQFHVIISKLV